MRKLFIFLLLSVCCSAVFGQCPPNIDFESGTLSNWVCKSGIYTGGVISQLVPVGASANRHTIITAASRDPNNPSSNLDYYGGFPLLCPNGSGTSLRLGSTETNSVARTASYTFTIPATANTYSVTYWYAVVFEDPGHAISDQPKFTAKVLDNTNTELTCASFTYVATSGLPGFTLSPMAGNALSVVYYKSWTPVTFDLSGRAGQTVTIEFTAEDCGLGGHFGYAYVDINSVCGNPISGTFCTGAASLSLKGPDGFQTYTWRDIPGNNVLGTTQTLTLTPPPAVGSSIKVDLVPFTGFGCPYSITTAIAQSALPTAAFSGNAAICAGASTSLSVALTGLPPWTIQYKEGSLLRSVVTSNPNYSFSVSPTVTTTYSMVSVEDGNCINSSPNTSATVSINAIPAAQTVLGGGAYCAGGSGVPVSLGGSQAGMLYKLFLNGSFTGSQLAGTGAALSFGSQLQAGAYAVLGVNNTNNACALTMTGSTTVKVDAVPQAYTVTGGGNYCNGGSGIAVGLTGSETLSSYQLFINNAVSGTAISGTGAALSFGSKIPSGTYTVIATNKANAACQQNMTGNAKIVIDSIPVVFSLNAGGAYCVNGAGIAVTLNGSTTGFQYQLYYNSSPLGTPLQGSGAGLSFGYMTNAGNYTAKALNNANLACTSNMNGPSLVKINPLPVLSISGAAGTCFGTPATFTASGASAYAWSQTAVSPSVRVQPLADTLIQVTGTDTNGCSSVISRTVLVYALPIINVTAGKPLLFCAGDSLTLTADILPGSGTMSTYEWRSNGFPVAGNNVNRFVVYQAGNYALKGTNSFGCSSVSPDAPVTVIPLPQGSIVTPSQNYLCEGSSLTLTAGGGITGYQWLMNGNAISGATNPQLTISVPGNYTVILKNGQCQLPASNDITISLLKKPVAAFTTANSCIDLPVNFTNQTDSSQTGKLLWNWDLGDGNTASTYHTTNIYKKSTSYTAVLTVTSPICPAFLSTANKSLVIDEPEKGIRYSSVNAISNVPYQLEARSFGQSYAWLPANFLGSPGSQRTLFTGDKERDYTIRITAASGCVTVDSILVRVFTNADIFVARAFTPNKDGVNDQLFPFTAGIKQLQFFRIYNRWGQLMYESADPSKGWDGTAGGKPQPMDTYTWMVQGVAEDGSVVRKTGNTLLIR